MKTKRKKLNMLFFFALKLINIILNRGKSHTSNFNWNGGQWSKLLAVYYQTQKRIGNIEWVLSFKSTTHLNVLNQNCLLFKIDFQSSSRFSWLTYFRILYFTFEIIRWASSLISQLIRNTLIALNYKLFYYIVIANSRQSLHRLIPFQLAEWASNWCGWHIKLWDRQKGSQF